MRLTRLLWLSGPLVVRDLVAGIGGVSVMTWAMIAGCAFASAGNLAWFVLLGLIGVSSLSASLPELRRLSELSVIGQPARGPDIALPLAA